MNDFLYLEEKHFKPFCNLNTSNNKSLEINYRIMVKLGGVPCIIFDNPFLKPEVNFENFYLVSIKN